MEKLCLKWNDFQNNISASYKDLHASSDFSDVTLVSQEGQQVEAHRIILSACSPFFMNVLKRNKHSHPLIYMRGLKAGHMLAIVDFIYHGETKIFQEDLDQFLILAEEFELKGLSGKDGIENSENKRNREMTRPVEKQTIQEISVPAAFAKEEVIEENVNDYGAQALPDVNTSNISNENVDELEEQINSLLQKVERYSVWACSVCGKRSKQKGNIRQHIEAMHIEGVSLPCDQCGKISKSSTGLRLHKRNHQQI